MADYVVDMGPYAGVHGGKVVIWYFKGGIGKPEKHGKLSNGEKSIPIPPKRRKGHRSRVLQISGASGNIQISMQKFPLAHYAASLGSARVLPHSRNLAQ